MLCIRGEHEPPFLVRCGCTYFQLNVGQMAFTHPSSDPLKGKMLLYRTPTATHRPPLLSPPPSFWPISIMTPPFWQPSISSSLPYVKVRGEEWWKPGCFCPGRYLGAPGVGGHFSPSDGVFSFSCSVARKTKNKKKRNAHRNHDDE